MKLLLPKHWISWLIVGLLRGLICLPWRWQMAIGRRLGRLLLKLDKRMYRTTDINIRLCFPELSHAERQQLIRDSFENASLAMIETANGWWASDKSLKNRLKINGLEHIEQALQQGHGVMLLGGHQSPLHLTGRLMRAVQPVGVVYREQHNAVFQWVNQRALNRTYQTAITRGDLFSLRRALKNNQVIWYAPDTDPRDKASTFVNFFNIQAATVVIPSRFARKCQAVLLPASYYRDADDQHYHVDIGPAITPITDSDEDNMARVNAFLETEIRKHPAQYLWQYKRFKTRPPGQPNPYKLTDDKQLDQIQ